MSYLILVINTGGTSTKVGLYKDSEALFVESIRHPEDELAQFEDINDQKDYREKTVLDFLKSKDIKLENLSAVAARGGLLVMKGVPGVAFGDRVVVRDHRLPGRRSPRGDAGHWPVGRRQDARRRVLPTPADRPR